MLKKVRRNIIVVLMAIVMLLNTVDTYAKESSENLILLQDMKSVSPSHQLGKITMDIEFYKFKVSAAGKITLSISRLSNRQKVYAVLYGTDNQYLNYELATIEPKNPKLVFYVKKPGTYTFRLNSNTKETLSASYTFEKKSNQGGASYSKATILKKGVKKSGILGSDTPIGKKQFYKFKISKEELVRLKITKGESCSFMDTVFVGVYKANDKKNPVSWGYIYEGQKNGTLYIRNSKNHKTEPGTYYVVVKKIYERSGFDYSLTWLNK